LVGAGDGEGTEGKPEALPIRKSTVYAMSPSTVLDHHRL
jgi:hypothetical protein